MEKLYPFDSSDFYSIKTEINEESTTKDNDLCKIN